MNFKYCHNCKDFTVKTNNPICTACGTRSKTDISCKPYRGVKIITVKEEICGTNLREKADGKFVDRKPDHAIWLSYGAGEHEPKFFDRKELEEYLDSLHHSLTTLSEMTDKEFAEEMNTPQEPIKVPPALQWSTSTRKIFIDNTYNIDICDILVNDPNNDHLELLKITVDDFKHDNAMMLEDFGSSDPDVKVYTKAIKEIEQTIAKFS